jgi:hypothetical protein
MADNLVITSKIKKMVKDQGLRTGSGYITALSVKVEDIIKSSIAKVKQEGKKVTLGAEDL